MAVGVLHLETNVDVEGIGDGRELQKRSLTEEMWLSKEGSLAEVSAAMDENK